MKIHICGDSFMSPDPRAPGRHFSEILSKKYNITNLAFPGVSNIDICLQIEQAIEDGSNLVIVGTTDSDRIDMRINDPEGIDYRTEKGREEGRDLLWDFYDRPGAPKIKLENFRDGNNKTFASDTIVSFLRGYHNLSKDQLTAIKYYLMHIYDADLKFKTDMWSINYWLAKVNHIHLPKTFCVYRDVVVDSEWEFHTTFETQEQAAKELDTIIKDYEFKRLSSISA